MKRTIVLLAFVSLLILPCAAQELSGRIEGGVTDPQGAVIPGASVVATHVDTNIEYRATTNDVGRFTIPNARLGTYRIAVENAGFKRAIVTGVVVEVGGVANLNIKMELGEITQEVTVTADTTQEIVNTTNAELGNAVDPRQVLELPLLGRNAAELAFLQAGVYYEKNTDGTGSKFFIHGQRHRSINFTLDGVDTQDNLNRASSVMVDQPLIALTAENVQEFRVITGISSAEFGRGGSQITAVTRAGSNDFHGSAFWFHRNDYFGANFFFNNSTGVPRAPLRMHQFGGRIGGPIWKDKAFFFFGHQHTREMRARPENRTVFTAEARQGIFRFLNGLTATPERVAANPGLIRHINLLECGARIMTLLGRNCFDSRFGSTGAEISSGNTQLDAFITGQYLANIPLPNNFDIGDGLNTGGFRFNSETLTLEHLPSFRLDYRFNDKHLFYGTINYVDRNIDGDFINGRNPIFPAFGSAGRRLTLSRSFAGALVSNFTQTMVNEVRWGRVGGENAFDFIQPLPTPFQLGLTRVTDAYTGGDDSARDNVTMNVRDTLSWVRGAHSVKFGGEWRDRSVRNVSISGSSSTLFDFNITDAPAGFSSANARAVTTDANGVPASGVSITSTEFTNVRNQINDLVGAIGDSTIQFNVLDRNAGFGPPGTPEIREYRNRELDFFFNDSWNFRSNLTVNLGVRWEWAGVPIETRGRALVPEGGQDVVFGISGRDGFFNPGVFAGTPCPDLQNIGTTPVTTAAATSLILNCAVRNVPGGGPKDPPLFANDFNNFAPVVSVAWDPFKSGKTSIRAGFRISYTQDVFSIIDGNLDDNEGLTATVECVPRQGNCVGSNARTISQIMGSNVPIPATPAFQLPAVRTLLDADAQDFRTYADDLNTAFYKEVTLSIQREFFRNWAAEVRYVATFGDGQRRVADFNEFNIFAVHPGTGQSFLDAFLIAQQNLACNGGATFSDVATAACPNPIPNPLMNILAFSDPGMFTSGNLMTDLEQNATGNFLDEILMDRFSRPATGEPTMRGGAFWGAVLRGDLPANFFNANPFVASSRRMENDGFSRYHAVEAEIRRRPVGGLTLQFNYTFQRAIADFDGDDNILINDTRPSSVRNPRYTSQDFMPRQQINANWIYELPFGRGKRFDAGDRWDRAVGGWQVGGIIGWRSGRPMSILSGLGMFHRSAVSDENTVNLSQNANIRNLRALTGLRTLPTAGGGTGLFWFDPCLSIVNNPQRDPALCSDPIAGQFAGLYSLPNPGELGRLPRTVLFGPRRFTLDMNLVKHTRITERLDFEFRWEVFNVFNNVNFGFPGNNIFDAGFGQIFTQDTRPREMQFAFKINF